MKCDRGQPKVAVEARSRSTEMTSEMREQQLVKETQRGMGRRRSVRSTHALMPVVQSERKAKRGEVDRGKADRGKGKRGGRECA